ncbi:MAG: cupredoxin domain-containing protein [Fimbriimonadales bacterium]
MKNITATALALVAGASLLGFASAQQCDCCGANASASSGEPIQAQVDQKGVQKATVTVNNGFSPSTINVKAGKTVQITFDTKSRGCADEVIFKSLNIRKVLTNGKKTVVTFTLKKPGTYAFACPMGMYKGKVVAK